MGNWSPYIDKKSSQIGIGLFSQISFGSKIKDSFWSHKVPVYESRHEPLLVGNLLLLIP